MKLLNRFFYLFVTLAVVGVLATSCEKEIIIEEDVDGFKEIVIEEDMIKLLEEVGEYSDPETGITFFVDENVPNLNEIGNELRQEDNKELIEDRSCISILPWKYINGVDEIWWNSPTTYSLYIDYYRANGYAFTAQLYSTGCSSSYIKTRVTNSCNFTRFDAFVGYRHNGVKRTDRPGC